MRCLYRPGWRKDVRIVASLPILLSFSLSCWKFARRSDGYAVLWLVLGIVFLIAGPMLLAISLVLNRFRRFEIVCTDERVICEARGLFGTRRREVPLAGTCVALKLAKNESRLGLVTNLKDKNEQITELARHLLPDACAELANWLNARLLKVKGQ